MFKMIVHILSFLANVSFLLCLILLGHTENNYGSGYLTSILFCQAFVIKEGCQVPLITGVISMPCTDVEPVSKVSTKNKDLFE